ncbi:MAG: GNAT family N-acetyltransferase [Candidatus Thorarchaeota archaeon]|nr:GNAT family N-acetyltransferase [Candidatus Thorarchaeota archaeon]
MPDTIDIEIRDYDETLAEGIAQMWNTWDELWPTSFTQGVPYTAERVRKQFGNLNAIAILIAIDMNARKPVGSCTLFAHIRDKDAAYVGTLGVSPEALGKKVGKRLLLESLQRALQKGYNRVDLNTWAGNMKAVPLYKKVGMMWNPEMGGVHMEDYIPGILKHPLSSLFFGDSTNNGGWYDFHTREPIQAPDEYQKMGMDIYPYEFSNGDNKLSVTVDRLGRGITAIKRVIDNEVLRVEASVSSHQVLCGLPYIFKLEIENSSLSELPVSLNLKGFKGLIFDKTPNLNFSVQSGETLVWDVPFHLDSSATLYRDNIRTPVIITELDIEGSKSELHTGLKIKTAAEIKTRWGECKISAGGKATIPLTILNNITKSVSARINLRSTSPELRVTAMDENVTLDSEGFGGTILEITSSENLENGTHDIWVSFDISINSDHSLTTREFKIPIFNVDSSSIAVSHDESQNRIMIISRKYNASFSLEGGILRAQALSEGDSLPFILQSEIGPPFGINPFRFAERTPSISKDEGATVVSMKAKHPDRPLLIEDRAIFENGSGIIQHELWVTNTADETQSMQLRLLGRGGGISFSRGVSYIPFSSGIARVDNGNFHSIYPATSSNPSDYSEGWIAVEQDAVISGQVWDSECIEEIRFGLGQLNMLAYPFVSLEPGETRRLSQTWFIFGVSHWSSIRRFWQAEVERRHEDTVSVLEKPDAHNLTQIDMKSLVLSKVNPIETQLGIRKNTQAPLGGRLTIRSPQDWAVKFTSSNIEISDKSEGSIASCNLLMAQDVNLGLHFDPTKTISDGFSIHKGLVTFATGWEIRKPFYLVKLGASEGTVNVAKTHDQNSEVYRVTNDLIEYAVSPDYGGCLISLRNKNDVEFLTSAFPKATPKPGGFFDNYYGGIQPIVFDDDLGEDLSKAKTNRESMTASIYESGLWKGVEIFWTGKIQRATRGVQFKLRYLTTPKSPLVLIQWIISNTTNAPIKFWPTIMIDPKMDEHLSESTIVIELNGNPNELRNGLIPVAASPSRNVVWIKSREDIKDTTGLCFMLAGDTARIISASVGDILLLGAVDGFAWIKPNEEYVITGALRVDPISNEENIDLQQILDQLI